MATDSEPSPDRPQPPDRSSSILPAEDVFLQAADPVPSADVAAVSPVARRPPGPGFWESIAWIAGLQVVQIGATLAATVLLLVWSLVSSGMTDGAGGGRPFDRAAVVREINSLLSQKFIVIIGIAQLAGIAYALIAFQLRQRPRGSGRLGWQCPRVGHWLLIVGLMFPLAALCSHLQNEIFKLVPWSQQQMEQLLKSMTAAPLWLVVLVIGAGPALGEELLFRGLIGRGLVARYGVVLGIAITSVLFGVMHLNPAQVIGTIPLGIAMHFVYLTSRSFWAPMTLHFLNNTFSVVLFKYGNESRVKELADDSQSMPGSLLLASAGLVATIGLLLWQTRVRYVTSDGAAWEPGYPTTGIPPAEVDARPVSQPPNRGLVLGTALCALGFAAAIWKMIAAG